MGNGLRTAGSVFFTISVVVMLFAAYVGLVYSGTIEAGAGWITNLDFGTWIAGFFVTLAVLFVILLFLFAFAPKPSQEAAPPEREPIEDTEPAIVPEEIEVTCEHCGRDYLIADTGERPLYHACPHCGHSDVLDDGEVEAEEELVPGTIRETPTGERELILRCTNCQHVFPTPFTDERPLYAYCPNCGRKGVLDEPAATGEETMDEAPAESEDEPEDEVEPESEDEPEDEDAADAADETGEDEKPSPS